MNGGLTKNDLQIISCEIVVICFALKEEAAPFQIRQDLQINTDSFSIPYQNLYFNACDVKASTVI
jgi:hypothetical protein